MKKIILSATLLGSFYFANAQVGIGTPMPATSAMLDITADDKGVLIPRVALTNETSPLTNLEGVTTQPVQSLLVYATGKKIENKEFVNGGLEAGFYYWNINKWDRIVDQTQLNQVISNQGDIAKIKDLLDAAYGSNNLGDTATSDSFGGMVFTPAVGNPGDADYEAPKFEYVVWNSTSNSYERLDISSTITDFINASETKTKIVTIDNIQYYVSESYTGTADPTSGNEAGVYKIDVVGGVVNNFNEILNQDFVTPITINGTTINDIKEYIQYLSQNSPLTGDTKIVIDATSGQASLQIWNGTDWNTVGNTAFSTIVKANQSLTDIQKTASSANVIKYVYNAEPEVDGTTRTFTIDLTADLIQQITNNTDIQTLIKNISNGNGGVHYNGTTSSLTVGNTNIPAGSFYTIDASGNGVLIDLGETVVNEVVENFNTIVNRGPVTVNGNQYTTIEQYIQKISNSNGNNVGYTTTAIAAGTPSGQLEIPANSFYYVNDNGIKVEIPLNDIVYTGITNLTETQVNDVKIKLGDNFKTTTVVKTGDVWTDGKAVYKGIFDAFIKNGTANVVKTATDSDYSEISISGTVGQIISISVLDSNGNKLTSSVTDVVTASTGVKFRIGTGNMYNVIYPGTGTTAIKVLIEYSAGAVVTP